MKKIYYLIVLAVLVCTAPLRVTWAGSASGDGAIPFPETIKKQACLECHGQSDLKSVTSRGANLEIHISEHDFDRSVHSNIECVLCHAPKATEADFSDTPHNIQPEALPSCMNCHSDSFSHVKEQLAESVHFEKQGSDISCTDCHNVHSQKRVSELDSYSSSVGDSNKVCIDCHTSAIRYEELTGNKVYSQDLSHDFLPARDEHFASVRCIECHTPFEGDIKQHQILSKDQALRDCESCHTEDGSFLVARIKSFTDIQQGGGAFLGKGLFEDQELISKMQNAGLDLSKNNTIRTREISDEEIVKTFDDTYVPGTGQTKSWDNMTKWFLIFVIAVLMLHGLGRLLKSPKTPGEDQQGEKIYPVIIRATHTINAVLFIVLLATGFSIHYADSALSLPMELSSSVHSATGIMLTVNFAIFILYNLLTGGIMQYIPFKSGGMESFKKQARYYAVGIFRGEDKPHHPTAKQRMNPIQQLTYLLVYCLGMFVIIATGFLLFVPEIAENFLPGSTTRNIATIHFLLAVGYLAFLLMHLYMITTGKRPASLIKGMATGHHYE